MEIESICVMVTKGLDGYLSKIEIGALLIEVIEIINRYNTVDFVVFDPEAKVKRIEDEDRTMILPTDLDKKIYAKLDDYGSPEALSREIGRETNARHVLTLMFADEY